MSNVIRQHDWTDAELKAEGFRYYPRQKQLVMAGRLPPSMAPMKIVYELETVVAEAGDIICYDPGTRTRRRVSEYDYWSVKPEVFKTTYRKWDEPEWMPNPPQAHLMRKGCRPYYKHKGVWARLLTKSVQVQSKESQFPIMVPAGVWLAIGEQGEPWHIDDETFRERYVVPAIIG